MMVSTKPYAEPKPSLRLNDKDLPDIKDWKVGKKYKVHAIVKMVYHSEGNEYGDLGEGKEKRHEAHLEIHSIKPAEDKAKDAD